jgi:hypothetical protein
MTEDLPLLADDFVDLGEGVLCFTDLGFEYLGESSVLIFAKSTCAVDEPCGAPSVNHI